MQTVFQPGAGAADTLTYLYHLSPGFAGTSHASHCALLCGVPNSVVDRAVEISNTGLKAWQDAQAAQDEVVIRRLLKLDFHRLKSGAEPFDGRALLKWVLFGQDEMPRSVEALPLIHIVDDVSD